MRGGPARTSRARQLREPASWRFRRSPPPSPLSPSPSPRLPLGQPVRLLRLCFPLDRVSSATFCFVFSLCVCVSLSGGTYTHSTARPHEPVLNATPPALLSLNLFLCVCVCSLVTSTWAVAAGCVFCLSVPLPCWLATGENGGGRMVRLGGRLFCEAAVCACVCVRLDTHSDARACASSQSPPPTPWWRVKMGVV